MNKFSYQLQEHAFFTNYFPLRFFVGFQFQFYILGNSIMFGYNSFVLIHNYTCIFGNIAFCLVNFFFCKVFTENNIRKKKMRSVFNQGFFHLVIKIQFMNLAGKFIFCLCRCQELCDGFNLINIPCPYCNAVFFLLSGLEIYNSFFVQTFKCFG